jgi:hypothetical protein
MIQERSVRERRLTVSAGQNTFCTDLITDDSDDDPLAKMILKHEEKSTECERILEKLLLKGNPNDLEVSCSDCNDCAY